jgi:hypothetical protein
MKKLSPSYRITHEDIARGSTLFAKEFAEGIALTEQERYFSDVLLDAADIHRQTGVLPTVSEVYDHWQQENHESERGRIGSWQDGYTFTQRDFDTLAEEESGPMFDFVSTAKNLKSSTGAFPTIGDVRAEMKKRQR